MIIWRRILEHLNKKLEENFSTIEDCLFELYELRKLSIHQIADLCEGKCTFSSIRFKLLEQGLVLRQRGGPNRTRQIEIPVGDLLELTVEEIADKHQVSESTIRIRRRELIATLRECVDTSSECSQSPETTSTQPTPSSTES